MHKRFLLCLIITGTFILQAKAQELPVSTGEGKTTIAIIANSDNIQLEPLAKIATTILSDIIKRDVRFIISELNFSIKSRTDKSPDFVKNRELLLQALINQVYYVSLSEKNNTVTVSINILSINKESIESFSLYNGSFETLKDRKLDEDITRKITERINFMPVQGLIAQDGSSTETIDLTWHHVPGSFIYSISRAEKENGPKTHIGATSDNTFTDNEAIPGRAYYYTIQINDDTGSPKSESASDRGYRKLSTPQPIVHERHLDKLLLTWNPVPGAINYQVYRYSNEKKGYQLIDTTMKNRYIDRSIDRNTVCHYKVTAWAETGPGETSPIVSGKYTQSRDDMVMRGIIPGWGQFYRDDSFRGFLYSGLFITSGSALVWSAVNRSKKKEAYDNATSNFNDKWNEYKQSTYLLWSFTALTSLIYIANWIDILLFNDSLDTSVDKTTTSMFLQNDRGINFSVSMSDDKKSDLFFLQITRFI